MAVFCTFGDEPEGVSPFSWRSCVVTMSCCSPPEEVSRKEWFAVQVDPKLTQSVLVALWHKGYEAFTPFRTAVRQCRKKAFRSQVPVFPGYVFARVESRYRLPILMTPGVRCLVGYGKQPIPICEKEIEAIRLVMQSEIPAEPVPFAQTGDAVVLVGGPLAGLSGILMDQQKQNRLLVRVTLIQQALAVDVDSHWVRSQPVPMGIGIE